MHVQVADLAAHKSPNWSILQVGGTEFLTKSLLSVLGAGLDKSPTRFSDYTVAHTDSEWVDQAAKWLPEGQNGVALKLFKSDTPGEAFNADTYDLVIVGQAPAGISQKHDAVSIVRSALKEGGTAILGGSSYSKDSLCVHISFADTWFLSTLTSLAGRGKKATSWPPWLCWRR